MKGCGIVVLTLAIMGRPRLGKQFDAPSPTGIHWNRAGHWLFAPEPTDA